MNLLDVLKNLDTDVLGNALLESILDGGQTREGLVQQLADQLDVSVFTEEEHLTVCNQNAERERQIEALTAELQAMRHPPQENRPYDQAEPERPSVVLLKNGMIVDTPLGKARVMIVDTAAA